MSNFWFSSPRTCLRLLFVVFSILPHVRSLNFKISRFAPSSTDILYEGTAIADPNLGTIEFNDIDYLCRTGRVTYADPVQIWDSDTGKVTDFSTHFSFFIDTNGAPSYGHGLAFFLAPVGSQIPPNSPGGFLGLFNTTTVSANSSNQIILVEFDSYWNSQWDPKGVEQHVGINVNSLTSAEYVSWNTSLLSDQIANAWITYNATAKNLTVFWTYDTNHVYRGNEAILAHIIDLKQVLPEQAVVGFSAATGEKVERHVLQTWEFSSSLNMNQKGKNQKRTKLVVGVVVPVGILVAGLCASLIILYRRRSRATKQKEEVLYTSITGDLERGAGPKKFDCRELAAATNNFSDDQKLGEGGFGCVYRGLLSKSNQAVAVKKISRGSKQGKKEYITEVKTISQLRHRNLVQLIGWCHDKGEFLLVYEFMPNGSLDAHLFGKNGPLNWDSRYKITLGLASGLLYLHEEWEQCVVHRDIKSSNVMLDSNFNAKLGDFGLARLMDHELGPQTTGLAGTFGYLAPEYISTGKASKESDVYSFGVVALEIACGRKSVDHIGGEAREMGLVEWVWGLYGRGKLSLAMDVRLNAEEFDVKQVERLMIVGLWCAHPDYNLRPSVRQAIQVMKLEAELPELPPKMPVPLYHVSLPTVSSSSGTDPSSITTSLDVGR
ncbi:hypothetical protein Sjap_022517 [Stephania japonica]|uniref:Protein kinase domain-containing protein n=1 Tax=Stephania japonica TaxID=461633 RepID=A0AAP0HV24_9MAGN